MTVETTARSQAFSGGQASLTYTFKALPDSPSHIKVKVRETATNADTELTYLTDYTVSQESDGVGGVVTVSPSYSTSYVYTVYRDTTKKQESDYNDYNQFPADTLEKDLDRAMCILQEAADEVDRALKTPVTIDIDGELPAPEDGQVLQWSGSTGKIVNASYSTASLDSAIEAALSHSTTALTHSTTAASHATTAGSHATTALTHATTAGSHSTVAGSHATTAQAAADSINLSSPAAIGDTTPNSGAFTTLTASSLNLGSAGATADIIRDEDDMTSDDPNALATQQSIKKYFDDNSKKLAFRFVSPGSSEHVDDENGVVDADDEGTTNGTLAIGKVWGVYGATYKTVIKSKYKKVDNVDTVTVYAHIKSSSDNNAAYYTYAQVNIGGQTGANNGSAQEGTWEWINFTVDVSGLSSGIHDLTIQLKHSQARVGFMDSIVAFES